MLAHTPITFLWLAADAWTAIGTVALAGVAVATAWYARGQLAVLRRTREDEMRPSVTVRLEATAASRQLVNLVIESIGRTTAHDVRLTFDPPIATTINEPPYALSDSTLIREGVPTMPPGYRITTLFEHGPSYGKVKDQAPARYTVTVRLRDGQGHEQEPQVFVLDLAHLMSLQYIDELGVHHAVKALRDIHKVMKRSLGQSGGMQVRVRDQDAHDQAEADQLAYGLRNPYWGFIRRQLADARSRISRAIALRRPGQWMTAPDAQRRLGISQHELLRRVEDGELHAHAYRPDDSPGPLKVWVPRGADDC